MSSNAEARMVWLHSLSAVHVGAGDAVDVIDLPVMREKVTNWPFLPGSGIKGVCRDAAEGSLRSDNPLFKEAFGVKPTGDGENDSAGSLLFADARLVCFPVRSLFGTFAWVTCPLALMRLNRDMASAGLSKIPLPTSAIGSENAIVAGKSLIDPSNKMYLEDLDFSSNPARQGEATAVANVIGPAVFKDAEWQKTFVERFAIVSDDVFSFLVETCTEVNAHISIDDKTKIVTKGALWYEEDVPAETIFAMPVLAAPRNGTKPRDLIDIMETVAKKPIQMGAKASVGRGLMQIRVGEGGVAK